MAGFRESLMNYIKPLEPNAFFKEISWSNTASTFDVAYRLEKYKETCISQVKTNVYNIL